MFNLTSVNVYVLFMNVTNIKMCKRGKNSFQIISSVILGIQKPHSQILEVTKYWKQEQNYTVHALAV